jgi:two-component system chemotaxis response regulator CheY
MKILVVDDSKTMRMLVKRSIRHAGFGDADILEAEDGADAINVVEDEEPDLILADWNMPNMTGIEMLETLRSQGNSVKVGFVTSESTKEIRAKAEAAGASFFISKPIDDAKLEAALDEAGV